MWGLELGTCYKGIPDSADMVRDRSGFDPLTTYTNPTRWKG